MKIVEKLTEATREVAARIGECVLDAMDCFGDDPLEDMALKSEIWNQKDKAA